MGASKIWLKYLLFNLEVRHPCCVCQITYMVDMQSKHNYLY